MTELPDVSTPPRRWILRGVVLALVIVLLGGAAATTLAYTPPELEPGTIESPANGTTIVAVQGFHFQGKGNKKKPARLVAAGERGNIQWVYNGTARGASWFYDVDPLPNGNILAVNTNPSGTLVYELNPETKERVWQVKLDIHDTHDVDLINGDELVVANMRNYDDDIGVSNDRIAIYDISGVVNGTDGVVELGEDDIVWQWYFKNHYPSSTDGGMNEDWSHVNDVDKIGPGKFMVDPRNFDQVIVINRSTKEIEMRLGSDGNHSILNEQHNPQYLETDGGKPTILVADSENDRVVEYTCVERDADGDCNWKKVWQVGKDQLNWPRDADRLPNGNTLIVDSLGHRVLEVTPKGKIVWEVYVPWAPYDAERMVYGDEGQGVYENASDAPTMYDMGVNGSYQLNGSAGLTPGTEGGRTTFPQWLKNTFGGTPLRGPVYEFAELWEGVSQWVKPIWMAPWGFVYLVFGLLVAVVWGLAELVYQRHRILGAGRRIADRVAD